jgi:hypothetical protein
MTAKRYQVFVSSTLTDLREERQQVLRVLLELDCIPSGMELFPASDEERWDLIRRVIDDCDYYIVIVGGRYGSVDAEGISFTEREYDHAVSTGKPALAFVHDKPDAIPFGKSEHDDEARLRLAALRRKLQERMCRAWSTAPELVAAVTTSLHQLMTRQPASGWIRGDSQIPPEVRAQIAELQGRVMEAEAAVAAAALSAAPLPSDSSLRQGDDVYDVSYQWLDSAPSSGTFKWRKTWDALLLLVSAIVRNTHGDEEIRQAIQFVIGEETGHAGNMIALGTAAYNQIMVQLEALGFIEYSYAELSGWRLTMSGRRALAASLALRRTAADGQAG